MQRIKAIWPEYRLYYVDFDTTADTEEMRWLMLAIHDLEDNS